MAGSSRSRLSIHWEMLVAALAALALATPANAAAVATSLTLAASPNPVPVNGVVTVSGTLSQATGGIPGKPIEISVTPPGGPRTVRATVTTGALGQFSYGDPNPLAAAGTYVYEARWSGDTSYAASTRTVGVAVTRALPIVSLGVSPLAVEYNRQAHLTVNVSGASSGTVSIYATPLGGVRTLIGAGVLNSSGNFSASLTMTRTALLVAEYGGNATHGAAASTGKIVQVRAIARVRLRGGYGRAGKYRLYRLGARPHVTGTVAPNHAGSALAFVAQKSVRGAWRTMATTSFPIEATGSAYAVLRRASRGAWRVRTVFKGDADHLGDRSPWKYLRFTG
jgi:hypothetical protein